MSFLRSRTGPLLVIGASALGGAAYRYTRPASPSDASLNPYTFTPYTVVEKRPVSPTSAIFTLRNHNGADDPEGVREAWKRSVWSVQVKQPELQIARAYTPLPPSPRPGEVATDSREAKDLRLLIRKEEGGEVSTYLHRLPEQETIELRGPNTECQLPQDIREVIFLAGGTGVAPAMQVAQAMGRRTGSRMHILWANRKREECLGGVSDGRTDSTAQGRIGWWKSMLGATESSMQLAIDEDQKKQDRGIIVQELESLKDRSKPQTRGLSVQYFVDEENNFIQPGDVAKQLLKRTPEGKGSKVIFVSGPDGFIEHWAGKKLWVDGREVQGPLGGVLGQMDLGGWSVFKL